MLRESEIVFDVLDDEILCHSEGSLVELAKGWRDLLGAEVRLGWKDSEV